MKIETMDLISSWLRKIGDNQDLINEFMKLINLCMNQNTFLFEDKYYIQIDGTTMGNPLSCFVANIFMSSFETKIKDTLRYFPRIRLIYVDDVFAVFSKNENLICFMNMLNSIHTNIKLTHEIERNNKLPYLGLILTRNETEEKLEYNIYRKETASFLMTRTTPPNKNMLR